ncbi:cation:proton antiporter [Rheinheimera sp. 1928-s]|uniref:cation:proton antiporter n=1 Tax=Rheinheimera sp. 1928-s TaxID=3033803 RepID=UPI0026190ACC|nr:cation:proton antiporter [Rheinheimera sp. 1928-s]MDF3127031.1 cation:proton antiporter [Rheinheimera sp. 1928-s]
MFPIKDPVLVFALVAALMLLAPIVMARYRLPGMIGLLFAGAVLGPNALNVLARDQSFVLFGTVGLLYIMFTAALEIDMAKLKKYKTHSIVFGLLTFAIPQSVGAGVGLLFGFDWPAAILLGSMFASHTLLAYPIASRLGVSRNQAVTAAVGGTILTDTLALLVLAVIAGMTRGEMNDIFWYKLGASLSLYVALILFGLPWLARWFFRNVGGDGVAEFVFVLAMVFLCASLSHLAGAEPIVGAFLAGLALNRLIPHNGTLMNRIQFTGEAIFIPFFLLSVGMLLDLSVFFGGVRAWLIAFAMVITVISTKWLAAQATRLFLGYSNDQAKVVFGLSVAQAAATLAATIVGHEIGLFDETVVNGAILMILVTCFLAPLMVDRYGRKMAIANQQDDGDADIRQQRIIVALADQAQSGELLELARLLRDPQHTQPVYPLTVVPDTDSSKERVKRATAIVDQAVKSLAESEVPAVPVTRLDLNITDGILRSRKELNGSELIVGWSEHTTAPEYLFGSMLEKLLADRHYTLLVSRTRHPWQTCNRLFWCLPNHAESEHGFIEAVALVRRLCQQLGVSLSLVIQDVQREKIAKKLKQLKVTDEIGYLVVPAEQSLLLVLQEHGASDQLIVSYGVRQGGLAWHSSLQELPTSIATEFPNANLLVIYPAEPEEDHE